MPEGKSSVEHTPEVAPRGCQTRGVHFRKDGLSEITRDLIGGGNIGKGIGQI